MISSAADAARARRGLPFGRTVRVLLDAPAATALAVCIGLSAISVVVISWVPSSDPYAWIDWGQEIASHVGSSPIAVGLAGGPSWKPFPAIFTTIFGLFGTAAPALWLIIPRAAGLLALVAAFRLGRRFGGLAAGIVAAIALCLLQDWLFYVARGASEPIVAALTLWAIDRHLTGATRLAYVLLFAATLNRPEFSVFLLGYAAYLWLRVPGSQVLAVSLLIAVPLAWLLPPLMITGNALQASNAALAGKGSPGSAVAELRSAPTLVTVPVFVLAGVGFAFALARRELTLQWLGVGAIVWALMVAVMTQVAYGLPRYLLPAATVACLLAGVAVVRIAEEAGRRGGRWLAVAVGGGVLAATLPWSIPRARDLVSQGHQANRAAYLQQRLFSAVDRVGGKRTVLPCRSSHVAINHTVASALAWKLKVPLHRVEPSMRTTGFVFRAPHFGEVGLPPPIAHGRVVTQIASVPPWAVLEVTFPGASLTPRCAAGDQP
jgi:hypothetical protein